MKLAEAQEIVAAYLTGQPVSHQMLQVACKTIQADKPYHHYLTSALAMPENWASECDAFLSRVAEFSEMSPIEQTREKPELVTHLEACHVCRRVYWQVCSPWLVEPAAEVSTEGKAISRRLAEPLRLVVDKIGSLIEQGIGPLSIELAVAGELMDAPPTSEELSMPPTTEEAKYKEWLLPDENSQCDIRLMVRGLSSGEVAISCAPEGEPSVDRQDLEPHIELYESEGDTRHFHFGGLVVDVLAEPLVLAQGSWVIRLRSGTRQWEIPLDIQTEEGRDSEGSYSDGE